MPPYLSIVIPIFNEEANIANLWDAAVQRCSTAHFPDPARPWEVVFTDDGSRDRRLRHAPGDRPGASRGSRWWSSTATTASTPPSSAPSPWSGARWWSPWTPTCRTPRRRSPSWWPRSRRASTWSAAGARAAPTTTASSAPCPARSSTRSPAGPPGVRLHDYGCMLRAYRREIVDAMLLCKERCSFIPALANSFAKRIAEVPVEPRRAGRRGFQVRALEADQPPVRPAHQLLPAAPADAQRPGRGHLLPGHRLRRLPPGLPGPAPRGHGRRACSPCSPSCSSSWARSSWPSASWASTSAGSTRKCGTAPATWSRSSTGRNRPGPRSPGSPTRTQEAGMDARSRILFVEDDPVPRRGHAGRPGGHGRRTWELAFADGGDGPWRPSPGPFDVVVADLRMPGMNGAQFLQKVLVRHPATVRFVLSGAATGSRPRRWSAGPTSSCASPATPAFLKSVLRRTFCLGGQVQRARPGAGGPDRPAARVPDLYGRSPPAWSPSGPRWRTWAPPSAGTSP